jgi:hypothetical protein
MAFAQRGRPRDCVSLADAAGRFAPLDDMHLDLRGLVDAQHPVVIEVRLLHPALGDGHLAIERRGKAEKSARLPAARRWYPD